MLRSQIVKNAVSREILGNFHEEKAENFNLIRLGPGPAGHSPFSILSTDTISFPVQFFLISNLNCFTILMVRERQKKIDFEHFF